MTNGEIARELGIKNSKVSSLTTKLRKDLKKIAEFIGLKGNIFIISTTEQQENIGGNI